MARHFVQASAGNCGIARSVDLYIYPRLSGGPQLGKLFFKEMTSHLRSPVKDSLGS